MHVIEFSQNKLFGDILFKAGLRYLVEDHNAAQFMIQGNARLNWFQEPPDLDAGKDWNDKHIVVIRCGALGDLLMLTPIFREIKRRWPRCNLTVGTFPRYRSAIENNPDVDGFMDYPVQLPEGIDMLDADAVVWLENAVETHVDARKLPTIDALAARFGVAITDYRIQFIIPAADREKAIQNYARGTKKRVGIQCRASAPYKTYPAAEMDRVAMLLYKNDWEVFLFGSPGEINAPEMDGLVNVSARSNSVLESAAIAATCDVILCPDSFFVHLAAALDKPCIALYGPFPSELYTKHYPKCRPIQGQGECSPCFHHPRGTHFPTTGPCWRSGRCEVLADITPRAVVQAVEEIYKEFK